MKQRQLGATGPAVSEVGLGCMGMSNVYGPADDDESIRTLNRAIDIGMTFFDTADMYGRGHNETLIGRVLATRRAEVFLATKFANRAEGFVDSSPEWALEACDASLKRLGTDTIDLYYMHRKTPEIPIEETVGAMASLVGAGKVRHIGLSEVAPATLRRAHAVHPVAAVQMEYSLFTRDIEAEMLATCRELGVALVAYSPYGRGLLTGTVAGRDSLAADDWRLGHPRYAEENIDANVALVSAVREVASQVQATPAQVALAWVLAQGDDVIPIPGTKRVRYVEENAAAADLALTPSQVEHLSSAVPRGAASGERYPAANMRTVGH